MKKRIECIVSGRVQMVMYRDFVTRNAKKLGLTGEVWNAADGTVYVVAEGEEPALGSLVGKLRTGSALSRVEDVVVSFAEATEKFSDFNIVNDR